MTKTLGEKKQLFAHNIARLILWANEQGYAITFGEALRTPEQQRIYLIQKKTKTKNSLHLLKLAIDLNLFKGGKFLDRAEDHKPLGEHWKSLDAGNTWGGDWGWDGNHYSYEEGK